MDLTEEKFLALAIKKHFLLFFVSVSHQTESCNVDTQVVWTTGHVIKPERTVIAEGRTIGLVCEEGWQYTDGSTSKTYQCTGEQQWNITDFVRCTSEFNNSSLRALSPYIRQRKCSSSNRIVLGIQAYFNSKP